MATVYTEFDSTQTNLLADIRTAILASTDWSRPNSGSKPDTYKATTTRGAQMVFDLSNTAINTFRMDIGVWRTYDGTTLVDTTQRYLYWRTSGGAATNPLHCIVSAGKEHIFISVEGPRANETGAVSATLGSPRNYFFMNDMVPYHAGDTTPVVFAGGGMSGTTAAISNNSHMGHLSRNYQNTSSWTFARLQTMAFPGCLTTETVQINRVSQGDGKFYLDPYRVSGDESGPRGRLASFFFSGYQESNTPEMGVPPIGAIVPYGAATYKLLAVNKSESSNMFWSQFGAASNNSGTFRSVIVAVPYT